MISILAANSVILGVESLKMVFGSRYCAPRYDHNLQQSISFSAEECATNELLANTYTKTWDCDHKSSKTFLNKS